MQVEEMSAQIDKLSDDNQASIVLWIGAVHIALAAPCPGHARGAITGIVEIALNAVQVSVNPCAVRAFGVGDNLVRLIPIVFACPPKRHQRRQKPVWRLPSRETVLEVRWGHDRILDVQTAAIC
jgi:hypothetical protein